MAGEKRKSNGVDGIIIAGLLMITWPSVLLYLEKKKYASEDGGGLQTFLKVSLKPLIANNYQQHVILMSEPLLA